MNFKKITAAFVSGAMALAMSAVSVSAATVELDSEYPGSWAASAAIPYEEFAAIGGDVKVTLTLETRNLANTADQFLIKPINVADSWIDYSVYCTSDTVVAKTDGFFCIPENSTSCEFVISAEGVDAMTDTGIIFQVQNVTIKSAELEAGAPEAEFPRVSDGEGKDWCFGRLDDPRSGAAAEEAAPEEAAPAEEEAVVEEAAPAEEVVEAAPAADTTATAPAATGNTAVASVAIVMVAAAAAAVVSKKK